MENIPRPEYPRPQMVRGEWQNLNGRWEFEFDFGRSGLERGLHKDGAFSKHITVPFCPESKLSGIGYTDFMNAVWYRRRFTLEEKNLKGRVLLHFGAVDYTAGVFVNGESAGSHSGGYSSFTLDITRLVKAGGNTLTVCAEDDNRSGKQPGGKQSTEYGSKGCFYTRTTGIWQTVWLEFVPKKYIKNYRIIPDPESRQALLSVLCSPHCYGMEAQALVSYKGAEICRVGTKVSGDIAFFSLPVTEPVLWDIGRGELYDLVITMGDDRVESYFGMRSVAVTDNAILLNGRPVFQRLVLDQGFYPDGICTAPDDEALMRDIELSMAAGFNGARLHQKAFEERFLYWADRLGYIVWGEQASWGLNITNDESFQRFAPEWREIIERDFNHPSIAGWCPLNETHKGQNDAFIRSVYELTKSLDPCRPVIDTSGYVHVLSDIFDIHDYEQNPEAFAIQYAGMEGERVFNPHVIHGEFDRHIPYFVSEYGGTWWNAEEAAKAAANAENTGWGYGDRCKTVEEVYARIEGLTRALLENPRVCAFCYTQLTDVEQEQNGIYHYDRTPKFDTARLKAVFGAPAAIETAVSRE
jgi:beta-galactosidase/beta-glucuronidase